MLMLLIYISISLILSLNKIMKGYWMGYIILSTKHTKNVENNFRKLNRVLVVKTRFIFLKIY